MCRVLVHWCEISPRLQVLLDPDAVLCVTVIALNRAALAVILFIFVLRVRRGDFRTHETFLLFVALIVSAHHALITGHRLDGCC